MKKRALLHLAGRVFNRAHAITPAKFDVIRGVLLANLSRPEAFIDDEDDDQDPGEPYMVTPEGIAVIPICGTLVRRASGMDALSGLISYAELGDTFADAMQDDAVKGVVLEIDSPGGECSGLFDLADAMYSARGTKPVYAVSDDSMFSAAYALGSAADTIYMSRTAGVGSIGVICGHCDMSQADKQDGLKYTLITYGDYKADGNPHEPLSDHARATIAAEVNRLGDMFVALVARNRRLEPDAIKAMQAGCYFGPDGVAAGLADKIGGVADAISDMLDELGISASKPMGPRSVVVPADDVLGMTKAEIARLDAVAALARYQGISPDAHGQFPSFAARAALRNHRDMFAVRCLNPAALAGEPGRQRITGCPVPYGVLSRDLGGFREIYEPGCFSESLASDDIYALFNHDESQVLGRRSAGTLAITEDATGVHFDITPPESARGLVESMQRGDIDGMSAAFYITKYHWEMRGSDKVRVIETARMVESSVATFPFFRGSPATVAPAAVSQILSRQKLNRARLESAAA